MADKRAFFKLDVGYLMNPKVAAVASESPSAVLLHIAAMGYAAQHLTDGVVPLALVMRIAGATQDDAELLFKRSLLSDRHDGDVEVHDYLEHQRSAAEAKAAETKAQRAARARWGATSDASSIAPSNAPSSASGMPREKREREERKSIAPARADDDATLIDIATTATRRKPERPIPDTWAPNAKHFTQAETKGVDITAEARAFRNHAATHDRRARDWDAAFRTWLDKARPGTTATTAAPISPWDRKYKTGEEDL